MAGAVPPYLDDDNDDVEDLDVTVRGRLGLRGPRRDSATSPGVSQAAVIGATSPEALQSPSRHIRATTTTMSRTLTRWRNVAEWEANLEIARRAAVQLEDLGFNLPRHGFSIPSILSNDERETQQKDAREHYEQHWEAEWLEQDKAKQWERRAGTVGRERKRASVNDSGQRSKRARN